MHDLEPITALGGKTPHADTIGAITITENPDLALASVTARYGGQKKTETALRRMLGRVPDAGQAQQNHPMSGVWMGPDQWMISAPIDTHETLAEQLKTTCGDAASVTEQTGAWVVFDVTGHAMPDLCERICNVPIRTMVAGDARRTVIHHIGCFVIRTETDNHLRILGPRSSAGSLHHALLTAARSIA